MTQFAEKDSKSLRRSGTEDEYEEQDQLLQELLDLAKEYNYKYRRIRKISDKHSSDGGAARLTKSAAGHSRDAAAAAYAATVNNNATNSATPKLFRSRSNSRSPCPPPAVDVESSDIAASPSPSSPADTTVPGDTHSSQGQQTARNEPVRTHGKRTQGVKLDTVDYQFLEKRMKHDEFKKEKDFVIESRRLKLEEDRLAWEKERAFIESELREQERRQRAEQQAEERRERAEDRRMAAAQQQALFSVLENIVARLNSK
ncbi:hypothetical protein MTO96_020426 [Rhipicephalus appendiculatus]